MQFSLFGAEAAEPSVDDLAGVLLAGGWWVRSSGAARLSVVVTDQWRADALAEAFEQLDAGPEIVRAEGGLAVRTRFSADLLSFATNWTLGANQVPPAGFVLNSMGLRLWAITSGQNDGPGYLLGTESAETVVHSVAGAQLARLGLAAISVTRRDSPGWRVTSVKRLRRLAEILGEPPSGAGADWPV